MVSGLAGTAAVVFVLLGYALRLAHAQARLADELLTAGWIAAIGAVVPALAGLGAMLAAAARNRSAHPDGSVPGRTGRWPTRTGGWRRRTRRGNRPCWNGDAAVPARSAPAGDTARGTWRERWPRGRRWSCGAGSGPPLTRRARRARRGRATPPRLREPGLRQSGLREPRRRESGLREPGVRRFRVLGGVRGCRRLVRRRWGVPLTAGAPFHD
ncbi:hypothetical protein NKH77_50145 [Streptomyces sp. M19]